MYLPYGGTRWESGATPTDFRFTGQRHESGFGLYDYNARYYDPLIGRFISADSIVPGAGNPQALNRYAYNFNNPVKYVDPTGHNPRIPTGPCDLPGACGGGGWQGGTGAGGRGGGGGTVWVNGVKMSLDEARAMAQMQVEYSAQQSYMQLSKMEGYGSFQTVSPAVRAAEPKVYKKPGDGNDQHYDAKNGNSGASGPTRLTEMYPETEFEFARRGQKGPDVTVTGGKHPSEYPNSNWLPGFDYGDFKPNTVSGMNRLEREIMNGKLPQNTMPIPYDPVTGVLKPDHDFGPFE